MVTEILSGTNPPALKSAFERMTCSWAKKLPSGIC